MTSTNHVPYQLIYENTNQFIGILTTEGVLISANKTALDFINCQLEDVAGKLFWETNWWTHDAHLQSQLKQTIQRVIETKRMQELTITHVDDAKQIQHFFFTIKPILSDSGDILYLIPEGKNVEDLYRAEKDRENAIQMYKDLFENSADAFLILENNQFTNCNRAALKTLGFDNSEEFYNVHPFDISPPFQPDGRSSLEKSEAMIRMAYENGSHRFEWVHSRKDGSFVDVEIVLTPIRLGEKTVLFVTWRDIGERLKAQNEVLRLNAALEEMVDLRTKALENTLLSLKQTQTELIENQKLAALSHLVVGISHEINTPIGNAITAATYMNEVVLKTCSAEALQKMTNEHLKELIQDIYESTDCVNRNLRYAAHLIDTFKSSAVMQSNDMIADTDIKALIDNTLSPFRPNFESKSMNIQLDLPENQVVRIHPITLQSILSQLISNALTHGFEESDHGTIWIDFKIEENAYCLSIGNNGVALPSEIVGHIFEPFFTTRRSSGNSGLGLNVVYNQVMQILKGKISVESPKEGGVEFVIRFPIQ